MYSEGTWLKTADWVRRPHSQSEEKVECYMFHRPGGDEILQRGKNGFSRRVGGKKESARTSSMSRKEKNCAEAFHLHQGLQWKSPAGGRRHNRAESVETPLH